MKKRKKLIINQKFVPLHVFNRYGMTLNEFRFLRSLQQKKYRREHRCFLVEGSKSVIEVLESNYTVRQVYATQQYLDRHPDFSPEVCLVSEKECERISSFTTPPEIFALAEMKPEIAFPAGQYKKLLLLDDIQNCGNMGTIIRTADWFGIQCVVCSENTAEFYNPKTIQATMGSFTRVDVYTVDLCEFIKTNEHIYSFIGTFMEGKPIREYQFPEYSAIVLGRESTGISPEVSSLIREKIAIPRGNKDENTQSPLPNSLNVSLSSAIICYELTN
jgi:TrmH family RNA methyltransferase